MTPGDHQRRDAPGQPSPRNLCILTTEVPLHFEGWAHFSQGRDTLDSAFMATGVRDRLHVPGLGDRVTI